MREGAPTGRRELPAFGRGAAGLEEATRTPCLRALASRARGALRGPGLAGVMFPPRGASGPFGSGNNWFGTEETGPRLRPGSSRPSPLGFRESLRGRGHTRRRPEPFVGIASRTQRLWGSPEARVRAESLGARSEPALLGIASCRRLGVAPPGRECSTASYRFRPCDSIDRPGPIRTDWARHPPGPVGPTPFRARSTSEAPPRGVSAPLPGSGAGLRAATFINGPTLASV